MVSPDVFKYVRVYLSQFFVLANVSAADIVQKTIYNRDRRVFWCGRKINRVIGTWINQNGVGAEDVCCVIPAREVFPVVRSYHQMELMLWILL